MKKWCALLMTLLLILTTAGAEEFSGGKDFWDDAYRCTVENGYLTFQSDDGTTYQPIAVREGFAKAAKALAAQGDTFVAAPMGLTQALLPYVADELRRRAGRDLLHDGAGWNAPARRGEGRCASRGVVDGRRLSNG